jgi:cytochrome P450
LPWIARYVLSPYRVFDALVRRFGDPVFLKMPESPGTVATGHRTGVKAIISADSRTLVPWKIPSTAELLTEHSIFLQAGDAHRALRKTLAPCFHASRHSDDCATMASVADAALDALTPGRIDVQPLAHRITLDIMLASLFGLRGGPRADRFHAAAKRALDDSSPLFLYARALRQRFAKFGRVKGGLEELKELVQVELDHRRETLAADPGAAPPNDMLALLVRARRADGAPLSDREIQVHLSDLIVAGHETTTVAIAWTVYELARHPGVLARLAADLELHGAPRDLAGLSRLPYLEAVCCEALRLHPPLAFLTRQTARPLEVRGYEVPAGYGVSMLLPLVHTDPETYDDPHAFRPERFLGKSFGPDVFLPFGGGAKRCLGATFALQEMMIVVAGLVSRFRITPWRRRAVRPRARIITIGPVAGVEVVLEPRAPRRVSAAPGPDPARPAPSAGGCPHAARS